MQSQAKPSGTLSMKVIPALRRPAIMSVADARKHGGEMLYEGPTRDVVSWLARPDVQWRKANQEHFARSLRVQQAAVQPGLHALGHLWLRKICRDGSVVDFGLAGCRIVTTVGANYIVDAFQNLVELEAVKYHGLGTGTGAEAVGNTTLGSELTTQYATNNVRATGTTGEQSGNPNVYETTALVTVDAAVTVTEHGVFTRAATGGGVLFDRTVFAGVPLASGDSLQTTYQFTLNAGG